MSRDLLTLLRDHGAFDPAPRHAELSDMHVPFDVLFGAGSCEQALLAGLRAGNRIALLGSSGAGKSSIVAHTLGPLVDGIFPIPVPVYPEPASVVGSTTEFVAHLVRTISRMLDGNRPELSRPARKMERRATGTGEAARTHRFSAGWRSAGIGPELEYELQRAINEPAPTAGQVLDQGRQILDLVASDGLVPILILDDTDRWLAASRTEIAVVRRDFFLNVPRLLAEDLGAAAVIAVHPEYLRDPGYQAAHSALSLALDDGVDRIDEGHILAAVTG